MSQKIKQLNSGHKCLYLSNNLKKTRFTETQFIRALKEVEDGRKTDDICRELEISKAIFYNWKSRYSGMETSDVKRLKELEEENARLKKMFTKLSMKNDILQEFITKKRLGLRQQKQLTQEIVLDHGLSFAGGCKLTGMCRSQYYYVSKKDDSAVMVALDDLVDLPVFKKI